MTAAAQALSPAGLGVNIPLHLGPPPVTAMTYTSQTALGLQITKLQAYYQFLGAMHCGPSTSPGDGIAFANQVTQMQSELGQILTALVAADQAQLAFVYRELGIVGGLIADNARLTAQVGGQPPPACPPAVVDPQSAAAAVAPASSSSATSASASAPLPFAPATAPAASPWPWGIGGTVIGGILGFAVGRKTAKKR